MGAALREGLFFHTTDDGLGTRREKYTELKVEVSRLPLKLARIDTFLAQWQEKIMRLETTPKDRKSK